MLDVPVHREESVISPRRTAQQLAVCNAAPPHSVYRFDAMGDQFNSQIHGDVLVK
jgi:hypothetical protein